MFTKNTKENNLSNLRKKYNFSYKTSLGPFKNPINFYINGDKLIVLNFGDLYKENGSIDIYDIRKNTLVNSFKLKGNPKALDLYDTNTFIIVKHLNQGIYTLNLKTGKEELFIRGENFINPTSVLIKNEILLFTDLLAHSIKVFSYEGEFIDEIVLRKKAEFPVEIRTLNNFDIILTLGNGKFYPKFSSQKEIKTPLYLINDSTIVECDFLPSQLAIPFSGLEIVNKNEIFILNKYFLFKYSLNDGVIFKKKLIFRNIERKYFNSFFYKIKSREKEIFILERETTKRIFVFKI